MADRKMEGREAEFALLQKQVEEMRIALSHLEIQKILHTLEKGKEKVQLESGEIPQNSHPHESRLVIKSQRDPNVGASREHEAQRNASAQGPRMQTTPVVQE